MSQPMIVKTAGIWGYNTWGMGWIAWDEIESVEPLNSLGLSYLQIISGKSSSSIFIPLFLKNQEKFIIAVCDRAPASNPLRLALESKNFQPVKKAKSKKLDIDVIAKTFQPYIIAIQEYIKDFTRSRKITNSSISKAFPTRQQPWMEPTIFPCVPKPETYGYEIGETLRECSSLELSELLEQDTSKQIKLVWTPESSYLTPPEEVPFLFSAIRTRTLNHLQQIRSSAIVNLIFCGFFVLADLGFEKNIRQMTWFYLVAFTLVPLVEYAWDSYNLRNFTPAKMARQIPEARYWVWVRNAKAPWTWALVGCIALVYVMQIVVSIAFFSNRNYSAIEAAGIVKQAVWHGEVWRLMTGTLLHGNLIHFLFNAIALLGLGKLVEAIAHRIYLPIIFLISALSGSLFSLIFLPDTTSVGASGGILGLLGFLVVLAWKQKRYLPVAFGRMLLVNVVYLIAIVFLAREVIDNAAHLGGFVAGFLLGIILIPTSQSSISPRVSFLLVKSSLLAGILILGFTMVSALKMLNV